MEYTVEFDETKGMCTVRVTGQHRRPQDSITLQQFARDFGEERNCRRFLFDMTGAQIVGGTMDTFEVGTVPGDPDLRQAQQRVALLYSVDLTDARFMEDVAANRGYRFVRAFNDRDKAVAWLVSQEPR